MSLPRSPIAIPGKQINDLRLALNDVLATVKSGSSLTPGPDLFPIAGSDSKFTNLWLKFDQPQQFDGAATFKQPVTIDSAGGTDLVISESGMTRTSGSNVTFTLDNPGAGSFNLLQSDAPLTGPALTNKTYVDGAIAAAVAGTQAVVRANTIGARIIDVTSDLSQTSGVSAAAWGFPANYSVYHSVNIASRISAIYGSVPATLRAVTLLVNLRLGANSGGTNLFGTALSQNNTDSQSNVRNLVVSSSANGGGHGDGNMTAEIILPVTYAGVAGASTVIYWASAQYLPTASNYTGDVFLTAVHY